MLWAAISRSMNLLAVLNIIRFFLTGAVQTGGYWFPLVSLALLALATPLVPMPLGLHTRMGFYLSIHGICIAAAWLLIAGIIHWLQLGSGGSCSLYEIQPPWQDGVPQRHLRFAFIRGCYARWIHSRLNLQIVIALILDPAMNQADVFRDTLVQISQR